jgi:hypothetical protein
MNLKAMLSHQDDISPPDTTVATLLCLVDGDWVSPMGLQERWPEIKYVKVSYYEIINLLNAHDFLETRESTAKTRGPKATEYHLKEHPRADVMAFILTAEGIRPSTRSNYLQWRLRCHLQNIHRGLVDKDLPCIEEALAECGQILERVSFDCSPDIAAGFYQLLQVAYPLIRHSLVGPHPAEIAIRDIPAVSISRLVRPPSESPEPDEEAEFSVLDQVQLKVGAKPQETEGGKFQIRVAQSEDKILVILKDLHGQYEGQAVGLKHSKEGFVLLQGTITGGRYSQFVDSERFSEGTYLMVMAQP